MTADSESLKIDIVLKDILGEEKKISSIKSLTSFIAGELAFWQEVRGKWRFELINQIVNQTNTAQTELTNFKSSYPKWDENQRTSQLRPMLNRIQQALAAISFSNTPFSSALIDACSIGQHQTQMFWNFISKQGNNQLPGSSLDYIEGLILGYEFKNQDESIIYKRREGEKRVLTNLRKTLTDKTDELITATDEFQRNIRTETEEFQRGVDEWKVATQTDLKDKIDLDIDERNKFFEDATNRLTAMETLYKEKLKLEGEFKLQVHH